MIDTAFPRDLLFTGALFGFVAFAWAGWAHERPPKGAVWRVVLVAIQLAGLALLGVGLPPLLRHWGSASALVSGSPALVWYIVITWVEIIAVVAITILFVRTGRTALIAAPVMIVVGLHFVPLGFVLGQPILLVAAVLLTAIGAAGFVLPRRIAAPSFWCGAGGGVVFVAVGATSLTGALGAL